MNGGRPHNQQPRVGVLKAQLSQRRAKDGYLDGYFGSTGCLKREFLDEWADSLAGIFKDASPKLTKSQLRAFFGETKRLQTVFRIKRDFVDLQNRLATLKALAYQRANRSTLKIPAVFQEFIERNIDRVNKPDDFQAFVQHFEAVVAYCEGRIRD